MCTVALLLRAAQAGLKPGDAGPRAIDTTFVEFFNGLCILGFMCSCQSTVFPVRSARSCCAENGRYHLFDCRVSASAAYHRLMCRCLKRLVVQVYSEMEDKSLRSFHTVTRYNYGIAFLLFAIIGCVHDVRLTSGRVCMWRRRQQKTRLHWLRCGRSRLLTPTLPSWDDPPHARLST